MSTDCLPDLHLGTNCGYPACVGPSEQITRGSTAYIDIKWKQYAKRRDTYRENKASFKSLHTTRSIATPQLHTPSDAGSRHVECCHPATVYYVYPPTYHECSVRMQGGGGADNTSNPHMYAVPCI